MATAAPAPSLNIKLTEAQQKNLVVAVLMVGLVGYGYWNYLYSPLIKDRKAKTEMLEQKKKELKDAREMVLKYPEFLQRSASINRRFDFINRRMPAEINLAETIREVTKKSTEANIKVILFEPEKSKDKGEYNETKIRMEFTTVFADLGNFLTQLGYIERLTTPVDLRIQRFNAGPGANSRDNIQVAMAIKIFTSKEQAQ